VVAGSAFDWGARAGLRWRSAAGGHWASVCELYLVSPHAGVAGVTGGDLKRRIEAIMSDRVAVGLSSTRKIALTVAGLAALAVPVMVGIFRAPIVLAQSPDLAAPPTRRYPGPEFDIASIKPLGLSRPMTSIDLNVFRGCQLSRPGLFHMGNVTLGLLIQLAYEVDDVCPVGGPAWVNSDHFEVIAETGRNTTPEQMRPMVKSLLEGRFKLKLRREMRDSPVVLHPSIRISPLRLVAAETPGYRSWARSLGADNSDRSCCGIDA
jgi:bla regulator protein blaR1